MENKWVCIQPTWFDNDGTPGATGPKKGDVVEVVMEVELYFHSFLVLRGWEYDANGKKQVFDKDGFRPLLDGDLRHQLDDVEQQIEEDQLVLVER